MTWTVFTIVEDGTIRGRNLGAAVCADGANGLTVISSTEARKRGLYVQPGDFEVPLVAYHPADMGARSSWQPPGRAPIGLDAPENMTGPKLLQMTGPGAGSYLSKTALVHPGYREGDARRYFDSAAVPGWVIPRGAFAGQDVALGDLAIIASEDPETQEEIRVVAMAYDVGPADSERLEMSVKACEMLKIPNCARSGGTKSGVSITVLPGSRRLVAEDGKVRPWSAREAEDWAAYWKWQ